MKQYSFCPIHNVMAVLAIVLSCDHIDEKSFFDYEVTEVKVSKSSQCISPEKVSDATYMLSNFHIIDTLLLSAQPSKTHSLIGYNYKTGDTLGQFCPIGRGPEDVIVISPYYDIHNGTASIIEVMTGRYMELNLSKSITQGHTVYDRVIPLQKDNDIPILFQNARRIGDDSLIVFNPRQDIESEMLSGSPSFSLYDLRDGHLIKNIDASFGKNTKREHDNGHLSPKRAINFHDCVNTNTHSICYAMTFFPQINFLDYETGITKGIRIKGLSHFDHKNMSRYHFGNIVTDGHLIYAIYSGFPTPPEDGQRSRLLIVDWDGNLLNCYELDSAYYGCELADGDLFFGRWDDPDHLYKISLLDL